MADLRALLADLGLTDVATYIQSGNVVFTAGPESDAEVEGLIAESIGGRFGFEVPVCVRSATDLVLALERSTELFSPGDISGKNPHDKRVHIGFLSTAPDDVPVNALDPDRAPGDTVIVDGREAHIYYEVGAGTTKRTGDYLERTLGVSVTARNLTTVRRLIALAS
jgi:uncharacterized protein (DUF1697 family)